MTICTIKKWFSNFSTSQKQKKSDQVTFHRFAEGNGKKINARNGCYCTLNKSDKVAMALMRSKEIPKDAVVLDEIEAVAYAWDIVSKWESFSDTWALKYGPPILGGINAVAGIIINNHYRTKLKLGTYGFYSSVIPVTLMPGLLTILFHRHLVSSNMLLMRNDTCPICYEIRSASIQFGLGMAYPMILAPTSAMMFANRFATYRLPDLTDGPKNVFQFLRKITKPFSNTLVTLGVCQLVASSAITYFEMRNNFSLRKKLLEMEKQAMAEEVKDL